MNPMKLLASASLTTILALASACGSSPPPPQSTTTYSESTTTSGGGATSTTEVDETRTRDQSGAETIERTETYESTTPPPDGGTPRGAEQD